MENKEVNNTTIVVHKKRRINVWATVIMAIIGVIAIAVITMAIVPKSYAVSAMGLPASSSKAVDDIAYAQIYQGSSTVKTTIYRDEDKKLFNSLYKTFESSFSQSSLSALFQKELGNKVEYRYLGSSSLSLSNITSKNDYVLSFVYSDYQTLYKSGKPYVLDYQNSAYEDGIVKFKTIWVTVNNKEGVSEVNFYIRRISTTGEMNYAIIEISTKGLQSELSSKIKDILEDVA